MEINKHNYQEILLLFIDGELTPEFEKEVQAFIDADSLIQKEFDELLNAKLTPESISFGDVSKLYKSENNCINISNYQEYFLKFLDNELNEKQKQETETFILQHPQLQAEFIALKKAKLPLENVRYPFKSDLYKKERTLIFYLQRMSIAAVFILAFFFIWNIKYNDSNTTIAQTVIKPKQVTIIPIPEKIIASNVELNKKTVAPKSNVAMTSAISNKNKFENNLSNVVTKNNTTSLQIQNTIIPNKIEYNNIKPTEIVSTNQIKNTSTESVALVVNNKNNIQENIITTPVKQIVYKILENDEDTYKAVVNNDSESKPSKLKGLFKKVMNSITPKDDNESRKLIAVTL